jgi:hypothetical protein
MNLDTLDEYWRAITVIQSEEVLTCIEVAQFPHMTKDSDRQKVVKKYTDAMKLLDRGPDTRAPASMAELAKIFGVKRV